MRINNNIAAINTHRLTTITNLAASQSIEKLSSGQRINKAGDDAAGLSISEKMRGQIRGLAQASKNGQDAISLVQTMEGASAETHSILQRMRELAVQAASDTNTTEDRVVLNDEVSQLKKEIDRIADTTEFNTMKVLNYGASDPMYAAMNSINGKVAGWINDSMTAINARFGIAHPDSPTQRPMLVEYVNLPAQSYAAAMGTVDGSSLILRINMDKVAPGGVVLSDDVLDGLIAHEIMHSYEYTEMSSLLAGGKSDEETWFMEGLSMLIQGGNGFITAGGSIGNAQSANVAGVFSGSLADYSSAYVAMKTLHEITVGGVNAIIDRMELGDTLDQAINNTTQQNQGEVGAGASNYANWADFITDLNGNNFDAYLTASTDFTAGTGAIVTGSIAGSSSNLSMADTITNGTGTALTYTHFTVTTDMSGVAVTATDTPESFTFHIGANSGQGMEMKTRNLTATGLGVGSVDLTTRGYAGSALSAIDSAISSVSQVRSYFGALQNRLEHTIKNIDTSHENLQASESRIRDVDMAKEMMTYTKNNILQQAAQSMLAQANQTPQGVLQLLR